MAGADDLRALDAAIEEIRLLHEAAEHAAARIGSEAGSFAGGAGATGPLVADVAEALVERTEGIRSDCERLSALLQRARAALAASAGRRTVDAEPVSPRAEAPLAEPPYPGEPYTGEPYTGDPYSAESSFVQPEPEAPPEPPSWQFWRRARRKEPPAPDLTPPRLPRPDYASAGVGPVVSRPAHTTPAHHPIPEGVRLIATQMAIAGSSRTEIDRRLQRQFGITDTEAVLNEIFRYGPATPAE